MTKRREGEWSRGNGRGPPPHICQRHHHSPGWLCVESECVPSSNSPPCRDEETEAQRGRGRNKIWGLMRPREKGRELNTIGDRALPGPLEWARGKGGRGRGVPGVPLPPAGGQGSQGKTCGSPARGEGGDIRARLLTRSTLRVVSLLSLSFLCKTSRLLPPAASVSGRTEQRVYLATPGPQLGEL